MSNKPTPSVVIINEGNNTQFDIDYSQYPDSVVFARRRRLRLGFWNKVLAGVDPTRPLQYLEIGCQEGSSTLWFLENFLQHPESHATVVDIFFSDSIRSTMEHNLRVTGHADKVTIKHGLSGELLRTLPLYTFDIIYLDALHASFAAAEDAFLAWRLLKDGGILIFDDYNFPGYPSQQNRPKMAIDFFLWAFVGKYKLLGKGAVVGIKKTYPDGLRDTYIPEPVEG
jgi:SAM-dependent methyltransferase